MKLSVTDADSPWTLPDERCPDVYFTRGYGEAAATTAGGRWAVLHWEDRVAIPYIVRPVDGDHVDGASPYGYSGVYVDPSCAPADLKRFWRLALRYWRDLRLVAMFFRFSPFDTESVAAAATLDDVELTYRSDTITVPVHIGRDAVWTGMEGRSRTAVRKAVNLGLQAELRVAEPPDLAAGSPFRSLYVETMRRVDSAAQYVFPDVYYKRLLAGLGAALRVAEVRMPDGTVVAAALALTHRDRVHYHLAGSTVDGARLGANNLLLWTILAWAADTGHRLVHLGGGIRPDDNLFRFKRSFGGHRTPFTTGALVVDPAAYDRLTARRGVDLGMDPDDLRDRQYFPAYRFGGDLM